MPACRDSLWDAFKVGSHELECKDLVSDFNAGVLVEASDGRRRRTVYTMARRMKHANNLFRENQEADESDYIVACEANFHRTLISPRSTQ
ncbi:hypothetical protein C8035_v002977 [Colletotrichum spinosum]|uniref:Uncharacterized protein n=1 Tax=Colletotrichum spinosum TaxID=1347390 RepID=A0A4R8PMT3_9PEZI|nr:hypothetical protein C8035_v002977 [Colletotrichum spinosum]